jgi:FixJ family two-component response regulator
MNFNSSINTGNEGFYWLSKIKEWKSEAAVIMITAYGDIDLAIRSLKDGAFDFVVKPWHNEKLMHTIQQAVKSRSTQHTKHRYIPAVPVLSSLVSRK